MSLLIIRTLYFLGLLYIHFFVWSYEVGRRKTMLKNYPPFSRFPSSSLLSASKSCSSSYLVARVLTGKRAINAPRKLRAENTLVEENNGARRKETVNTAAPRKITLMYLYNGRKSSFIMTQDSLEYFATTWL